MTLLTMRIDDGTAVRTNVDFKVDVRPGSGLLAA